MLERDAGGRAGVDIADATSMVEVKEVGEAENEKRRKTNQKWAGWQKGKRKGDKMMDLCVYLPTRYACG